MIYFMYDLVRFFFFAINYYAVAYGLKLTGTHVPKFVGGSNFDE